MGGWDSKGDTSAQEFKQRNSGGGGRAYGACLGAELRRKQAWNSELEFKSSLAPRARACYLSFFICEMGMTPSVSVNGRIK